MPEGGVYGVELKDIIIAGIMVGSLMRWVDNSYRFRAVRRQLKNTLLPKVSMLRCLCLLGFCLVFYKAQCTCFYVKRGFGNNIVSSSDFTGYTLIWISLISFDQLFQEVGSQSQDLDYDEAVHQCFQQDFRKKEGYDLR